VAIARNPADLVAQFARRPALLFGIVATNRDQYLSPEAHIAPPRCRQGSRTADRIPRTAHPPFRAPGPNADRHIRVRRTPDDARDDAIAVPNEAHRAHSRRFCRPTLSRPNLARRRLGHACGWYRGYAGISLLCDRDVTRPLTSGFVRNVGCGEIPPRRHGYDDGIVSPMKIPCPRRRGFGGKHEQFCGGRAHRRVSTEYAAR
jgi:hypothetical protein